MAYPTYTEHELESIILPCGTLHPTLLIDSRLGITAVPQNNIFDVGEVVERVEAKLGYIELASMQVKVFDSYDETISRQFWHHLIQTSASNLYAMPEMRFTLDEGSGETFLFWGIIDPQTVEYQEQYIDGEDTVRIISFDLVSALNRIAQLSWEDYIEEITNGTTDGTAYVESYTIGGAPRTAAKLGYLIRGAMKLVFPKSEGNEYDLTYYDIQIRKSTTTIGLDDLCVLWATFYSSIPGEGLTPYFNKTQTEFDDYYLGSKMTVLEFIVNICKLFAWFPRLTYDVSADVPQLKLMTRGRDASVVSMNNDYIKKSTKKTATPYVNDGVYVSRFIPAVAPYDWTEGYGAGKLSGEGIYEQRILFIVGNAVPGSGVDYYQAYPWEYIGYWDGATVQTVDNVTYWNYADEAYSSAIASPVKVKLQRALALYYLINFVGAYSTPTSEDIFPGRAGYLREYYGLKHPSSHTTVIPLMKANINDGTNTKTYYANEVKKNLKENVVSIEWIQYGT